jgi:hypothetical protein
MFTATEIQARKTQRPFVPLRIVTSSGETYVVRHPEMLFVGIRDISVGKPTYYDPTIYSEVTRIAIMHIIALENLSTPGTTTGDGIIGCTIRRGGS